MADQWYYAKESKRCGPCSYADLKRMVQARKLLPNDMVYNDGAGKWVSAQSVPGLFTALVAAAPPQLQPGTNPHAPTSPTALTMPEQLRERLLLEPHNIELRKQYLACRTTDLQRRDRIEGSEGFTVHVVIGAVSGGILGVLLYGLSHLVMGVRRLDQLHQAGFFGSILLGAFFGAVYSLRRYDEDHRRSRLQAELGPLPLDDLPKGLKDARRRFLGETIPTLPENTFAGRLRGSLLRGAIAGAVLFASTIGFLIIATVTESRAFMVMTYITGFLFVLSVILNMAFACLWLVTWIVQRASPESMSSPIAKEEARNT